MSQLNDHIREQAVKLGRGETENFIIAMEWLEDAMHQATMKTGRTPNINASYVRTLVNRVSEVALTSRTVQVRRDKSHPIEIKGEDGDTDTIFRDVLVVSLGNIVQRKKRASKTDEANYRSGYKAGIDEALKFNPDVLAIAEDKVAGVIECVKQYRAHLQALKDGLK